MSMQVEPQQTAERSQLLARLHRLLLDSGETVCGLILVRCALDAEGLDRLRERAAAATNREAPVLVEPLRDAAAILLPDEKLSGTHYAALAVKEWLRDAGLEAGPVLIASFPECGVPKEADLRAMQAIVAEHTEGGDPILIYNQPDRTERSRTVLIVDEDETVGELLDSRLRLQGYEVFKARDGSDGLRLFDALSPDLVITELKLPVVDGFDLIRSIRQRSREEGDCRILVLSENRMERDISRCFELGASDYIRKPFSPLELEARIRRLFH